MASNATASTLPPSSALVPALSSPPSSSPPSDASSPAPVPSVTASPAASLPPSQPPPSQPSSPASSDTPSSPPPAESSAAPPPASSAPPAASSAAPAPSTSAAPATSSPPPATQVVTASSPQPTTDVATLVVTSTPTGEGQQPTVIFITSTVELSNTASPTNNGGASSTSVRPTNSGSTQLQNAQKESSGLTTGGKTAIAVVIPVVAVALLVLAGLFLWRKRKARKTAEDERRKEVEEYGFNPNHDPTLPAVGGLAMAEDDSGYRGWGNTATSSNRKASTTLTSGLAYSDSTSNPGGYNTSANNASANSPTQGTYSDAHSNDPLVNGRRETLDSDAIGALGIVNGPAAASRSANNAPGVHRGPSNASSSYSAGGHSDNSGEYPGMAQGNPQEYYNDQGYYQSGPYGNADGYAGGAYPQPIIRDVSARRNTRIENPSVFPQQGNSGIAQNF